MTHSRSLHLTLALAAALVLALPGLPRAAEPSEDQSKKAAKAEKKQAEQEAKEEAKAAKADKKGKATKESRRREQIETGAKTAVDWYADALKLYQSGKYLDARGILLPLAYA